MRAGKSGRAFQRYSVVEQHLGESQSRVAGPPRVGGQFEGHHVNVFTADANGNNAQQLALSPTGEPRHLSSDGKQLLLAVPADDGRITTGVINVDGTGQQAFALPAGALTLSCVDWSPDLTRLVCEGFAFADDPTVNGVYTVAASDGQDLVRLTQQGDVPCEPGRRGAGRAIHRELRRLR